MEDFIQNRFGYCFYEVQEDSALIYNLYVHSEYRRQGKAKILLKHAINEIRFSGYIGEIEIEVLPRENFVDLKTLSSFYERMGLKVLNKDSCPFCGEDLNIHYSLGANGGPCAMHSKTEEPSSCTG